jgi:hypothetical protein
VRACLRLWRNVPHRLVGVADAAGLTSFPDQ